MSDDIKKQLGLFQGQILAVFQLSDKLFIGLHAISIPPFFRVISCQSSIRISAATGCQNGKNFCGKQAILTVLL